jgi:hypothetical protein
MFYITPGFEMTAYHASRNKPGDETSGKFIIGLRDDLEEEISDDESAEGAFTMKNQEQGESGNKRTLLRTLQLEMVESSAHSKNGSKSSVEL